MIRVANLRHQIMVEPEFRVVLLRNLITAEGEEVRRFRLTKPKISLRTSQGPAGAGGRPKRDIERSRSGRVSRNNPMR
jgi:hypothetical protein